MGLCDIFERHFTATLPPCLAGGKIDTGLFASLDNN